MLRTVRNVFFRWFALLFFPSPVSIKNNDDAIVLDSENRNRCVKSLSSSGLVRLLLCRYVADYLYHEERQMLVSRKKRCKFAIRTPSFTQYQDSKGVRIARWEITGRITDEIESCERNLSPNVGNLPSCLICHGQRRFLASLKRSENFGKREWTLNRGGVHLELHIYIYSRRIESSPFKKPVLVLTRLYGNVFRDGGTFRSTRARISWQ